MVRRYIPNNNLTPKQRMIAKLDKMMETAIIIPAGVSYHKKEYHNSAFAQEAWAYSHPCIGGLCTPR